MRAIGCLATNLEIFPLFFKKKKKHLGFLFSVFSFIVLCMHISCAWSCTNVFNSKGWKPTISIIQEPHRKISALRKSIKVAWILQVSLILHILCSALWLTEFNQGHLCNHRSELSVEAWCAQSVSKQLRTMSAPALESINNPSAAARIGPHGIEMAKFKIVSFHSGILWSRYHI